MMNIIRADIYRIVRGKALYITFAALLAIVVLVVVSMQEVTVGIQMEKLEESLENNGQSAETMVYDGVNTASILYTNMDIPAYYLLPLFILVAAPMFSHGAVKNSLSCGLSRTKMYFAKLILSSALCLIMLLFYMVSGMALATILRGFGGPAPAGFWSELCKTLGAQLLMLLALNCVGTFLVFTTKRTAAVNGAFIAFCLVPQIIILILSNANADLIKLYDYNLFGSMKKLAYLSVLTSPEILKALAVGAFHTVASTIAGVMLFKRAEIK